MVQPARQTVVQSATSEQTVVQPAEEPLVRPTEQSVVQPTASEQTVV